MLNNQLGKQLASGKIAIGISSSFAAPGIIELMCPGFDFCWIDAQHGLYSYDSVAHACRAAAVVGVPALVRTESHDSGLICKYADLAPQALMIPMVNTPEEAEHIFPPLT